MHNENEPRQTSWFVFRDALDGPPTGSPSFGPCGGVSWSQPSPFQRRITPVVVRL